MSHKWLLLGLAVSLALGCGCDQRSTTDSAVNGSGSSQAALAGSPSSSQINVLPEKDKQAINDVLQRLYAGYSQKDLPTVLALLHDFSEKSALDYAKQHPEDSEAADKIRDAYVAFHEDLFNHKDYAVEELHLDLADYVSYPDGTVQVVSAVPIIGASSLSFEDNDGNVYTVRLRLGKFVFKRLAKQWRIVEMDLF